MDCDLTEADFSDCDLSAVDFAGTDLDGARFERANLTDTSFVGALGYRLDVRTTRFAGTKFALPEALRLFDSLPIVIEELDPSPPVRE